MLRKTFSILVMSCFLSSSLGIAEQNEAIDSKVSVEIKEEFSYVSPTVAGLLSIVVPGGGHYYQQRWGKGAFFTLSEGTLITSLALVGFEDSRQDRMFSENVGNLFFNEHLYNIYSSYQDARILTRNEGYETPIARDSFLDIVTAPADPSILTRWTFFLPLAIPVGLVAYEAIVADDRNDVFDDIFSGGSNRKKKSSKFFWGIPLLGAQSTMVGIGEESFFRGYLQPELTELYGGYEWLAIFTQAALFGAGHYNYGSNFHWTELIQPVVTGLSGVYDGWITKRNDYSLRENIAGHAWWDFILFTGELLINGETPDFVLSLPTIRF